MGAYFIIIGIIDLIGSLAGTIATIVRMTQTFSVADASMKFLLILLLIFLITVAPAVGLLFIEAGDLVDKRGETEEQLNDLKEQINILKNGATSKESKNDVTHKEIKNKMKNTSTSKEENKQEHEETYLEMIERMSKEKENK